MQDILELERRIAAAFDRIDRGLELADRTRAALAPPTVTAPSSVGPTEPAETPAMTAMVRALESARASSADWAARYAALETQMADETLSLANQLAEVTQELSRRTQELDAALGNVSGASTEQHANEIKVLEDQMAAMRDKISAQSLELTALRSQRASEAADLKAIVAALTPLIEEAQSNA